MFEWEYNFVETEREKDIFNTIFYYISSVIIESKIDFIDFSKREIKTKFEINFLEEDVFFDNFEKFPELLDYNLFYNDLNWETLISYLESKLDTFDFLKFAYFIFEEALYNNWNILSIVIMEDIINSKKLSSKIDRFKIYEDLIKKYPWKSHFW